MPFLLLVKSHALFPNSEKYVVEIRLSHPIQCTLGYKGRKFRDGFCLQIFQASWAKNYDLLRVIAVHGTMTIKFYVEF